MSRKPLAIFVSILIISSFFAVIGLYNFGYFETFDKTNENQALVEQDSDGDGLLDAEEVDIYGTDPNNIDSDGDYVNDYLEVIEYHSNPLKIDSDNGGMDDFNEIYTYPHYNMNPNDSQDDLNFIEMLPSVTARHWELDDGDVRGYTPQKYVEISMRDPLIKHLAENSELRWFGGEAENAGFFVDGELIWKSALDDAIRVIQPSYYFTNGRKGNCVMSTIVNDSILRLMGYETKEVSDSEHSWLESYINGRIYAVNFNDVYPRDQYYEMRGWNVTSMGYDPDWYKK